MKQPKNDVERLQVLLDAIEESILSASDAEILEDVRLAGEDPDQIARSVRCMIDSQIKAQRQQKLKAAREGYAHSASSIRSPLAKLTNPDARRAFLGNLLSRSDDLTMAFREGKEMSDDDVSSLLQDMADLGIIKEDDDR